jgi:hypothetical protein
MELNEIKKVLYKTKPVAHFQFIGNKVAHYTTVIDDGDTKLEVKFEVPVDDMGTADFFVVMDAKLLNRWIVS